MNDDKKTNEDSPAPAPSKMKMNDLKSNKMFMTFISVIAALGAGFITRTTLTNLQKDDSTGTVAEQAAEFLDSTESREYVSALHNFRVDFNGSPAVESTEIEIEGVVVPFTTYLSGNNEQATAIVVADHSGVEDFDVKSGLEASVNGAAANTSGTLNSIEFIEFNGYEAAVGNFTAPLNGEFIEGNILAVYRGKTLFGLLSTGLDKAEFDQFTNSFEFTDQ